MPASFSQALHNLRFQITYGISDLFWKKCRKRFITIGGLHKDFSRMGLYNECRSILCRNRQEECVT